MTWAADAELRDDALAATEPADPHHPPPGCHYHPRCPAGPQIHAGRDVCRTRAPALDAAARPHRAACHFGATADLALPKWPPAEGVS